MSNLLDVSILSSAGGAHKEPVAMEKFGTHADAVTNSIFRFLLAKCWTVRGCRPRLDVPHCEQVLLIDISLLEGIAMRL